MPALVLFLLAFQKCHSFSGSVVWFSGMLREGNCPLNARARALGAVKEAIAYSMAALLLAEKLGTFI